MARGMRDSGVSWIGDIPNHWVVRKVRAFYKLTTGFTPPSRDESLYDANGRVWLTISDLKQKIVCDSKQKISNLIAQEHIQDIVPKGSLLYSFKLSVGTVAIAGCDLYTNEAIAAFHPSGKIHIPFLYYSSSLITENARENIYGARLMNQDLIYSAPIVFPPLSEQRAIADYLDEKCGAIDAAIAEAKKGIEEYKAWKKAIIEETVFSGLRHKESVETGDDWLISIPSSWGFEQIRYLFALRDERNDKPLSEVNLISLYTDQGVVQHCDLEKTTGNKASTADGYKIVKENDIVVNIILCWMGAIGRSAYNGVTSPAYDVYQPIDESRVLSKYYHYLFRTSRFNGKCYQEGRGIMMMRWRTYSSEFRAIKVPVPPMKEQQAIADYLDEKCAAIDTLVAEKEKLIADLEAYKKSLIFELVTGKREVA